MPILFRLVLSMVVALYSSAVLSAEGSTRPNVLFILADDLGWGDIGCYGHPELKTPHLDQLAAEGLRFTQFYVNAPACSPSRAAFLTGRYPGRLGIHAHIAGPDRNADRGIVDFLDPEAITLMDLMKSAGYTTGHFGKWHLGIGEGSPEPEAYGVDDSVVLQGNGRRLNRGPVSAEFWQQAPTLVADEVVRFMKVHAGEPWFINYSTLVPHAPLNPTAEQMEPYRRYSAGAQAPFAGATQVYYAAVSELDRQIGRVLATLDELGLADNTLVVFTSDNGPEDIRAFNAAHSGVGSTGPFRGRKRSLYEGGLREPLILRWPGRIPAGTIDEQSTIAAIDFMPTLAKLCTLPLDGSLATEFDGEDVSSAWLGEPRPERQKALYWEWRFRNFGPPIDRSPQLAIRDGEWKLLANPDGSRRELYQFPDNATEVDNRLAEHPDIAEALFEKLMIWRATLPEGPVDPTAGTAAWPIPN